jgi:hypothetical protein
MKSPAENENLAFDHYAIRLMIGLIALLFPWVVTILAWKINDSISWSYHATPAWQITPRDVFVGFLFVLGAFLMSYQGHKPEIQPKAVGKFWLWLSKYWKGAINFRIWEKKNEEDLVSWAGGVAAWVTALNPTSKCIGPDCPSDPVSTIHYIGAIILFSTTVYFCLVAFRNRASAMTTQGKDSPAQRRSRFYLICGWGIAAIMVGVTILKSTLFGSALTLTFWAEAVALELFGIAWLIASKYLPFFTDETERRKLF